MGQPKRASTRPIFNAVENRGIVFSIQVAAKCGVPAHG
jgi:hypothetical protein